MPYERRLASINTIVIAGCLPAQAQTMSMAEANSVRREYCSIASPEYTGPCSYTFTTTGVGKGLNIHFDLNYVGDRGVAWVVSGITREDGDTAFLSTSVVLTRLPAAKVYKTNGSCSVKPAAFKCVTSDGSIQTYATGAVQ